MPSAGFMGGREHELLGAPADAGAADASAALARGTMLLPSVVQGSGPFPDRRMRWTQEPQSPGERAVAVGWYLALMTVESLSIIGADGPTLVEGPLAASRWFIAMLASATGRPAIPARGRTGTVPGAAMLAGRAKLPAPDRPAPPTATLPPMPQAGAGLAAGDGARPHRAQGSGSGIALATAPSERYPAPR